MTSKIFIPTEEAIKKLVVDCAKPLLTVINYDPVHSDDITEPEIDEVNGKISFTYYHKRWLISIHEDTTY